VRVTVHYLSGNGEQRTLKTPLLAFVDTGDGESGNATVQFSVPKRLRVVLLRQTAGGASSAKWHTR